MRQQQQQPWECRQMPGIFRNVVMGIGTGVALLALTTGAFAQRAPNTFLQEMLIKVSLLTFNDANLTGNYSVFHARLSKPFRDKYSPEQIAAGFKGFRDQKVDLDLVAAMPPIPVEDAKVDDRGVLRIKGYFGTEPSRVNYDLQFVMSDGEWKLFHIAVNVKEP
jgi:hypothetical protein